MTNAAAKLLRHEDKPIFMTVAKQILSERFDFDTAEQKIFEELFDRRLFYYMTQLIAKYEQEQLKEAQTAWKE